MYLAQKSNFKMSFPQLLALDIRVSQLSTPREYVNKAFIDLKPVLNLKPKVLFNLNSLAISKHSNT